MQSAGTFSLGYFDGGTSGPGLGEPIAAWHIAPPLDIEYDPYKATLR